MQVEGNYRWKENATMEKNNVKNCKKDSVAKTEMVLTPVGNSSYG